MVELLTFGILLFVRGTKWSLDPRLTHRAGLRCPKCGWQPTAEDRWSCGPDGCGHVWNTFETAGRCPACDRHWRDTACLRCGEWSPHEAWYAQK